MLTLMNTVKEYIIYTLLNLNQIKTTIIKETVKEVIKMRGIK